MSRVASGSLTRLFNSVATARVGDTTVTLKSKSNPSNLLNCLLTSPHLQLFAELTHTQTHAHTHTHTQFLLQCIYPLPKIKLKTLVTDNVHFSHFLDHISFNLYLGPPFLQCCPHFHLANAPPFLPTGQEMVGVFSKLPRRRQ